MSALMTNPDPRASLMAAWTQARREWRANARLRWGGRVIVATLWVWLALVAQDQAKLLRLEADDARAEIQRLQPLQTQTFWPQRAEEARTQLEAARGLLWTAASQGQAEALLQDALRELSSKAGLTVRELGVATVADTKGAPDGVKPLRARLVVDLNNRLALMGLLAEMGRSPRVIVVDGLRLRLQPAPGRAEIEVRALFRLQEKVT